MDLCTNNFCSKNLNYQYKQLQPPRILNLVMERYLLAGMDVNGGGIGGTVGVGGGCIAGGLTVRRAIKENVRRREKSRAGIITGSKGHNMRNKQARKEHKHAILMILKINRLKVARKDLPFPGSKTEVRLPIWCIMSVVWLTPAASILYIIYIVKQKQTTKVTWLYVCCMYARYPLSWKIQFSENWYWLRSSPVAGVVLRL